MKFNVSFIFNFYVFLTHYKIRLHCLYLLIFISILIFIIPENSIFSITVILWGCIIFRNLRTLRRLNKIISFCIIIFILIKIYIILYIFIPVNIWKFFKFTWLTRYGSWLLNIAQLTLLIIMMRILNIWNTHSTFAIITLHYSILFILFILQILNFFLLLLRSI